MKKTKRKCMELEIEDITATERYRKRINELCLGDIKFFENGKRIKVSKKLMREFHFTGLSNIDFIMTGFYKDGWNEKD